VAWGRIKGHSHILEGFQQVAHRHRLGHAYLFIGPEGIGKRMFAHELGKAMLCEMVENLTPCDRCSSCLLIEAGTHPDFLFVRRPEDANVFPVELMRDLCQSFSLKSARGRGKVAILEDADDLNDESANTFLKTLEEPPPSSLFLLIGSSRSQLIPTILSRCQVIRFAPLAEDNVADILRAKGVSDESRLRLLLGLCPGSPGQALSLADDELWNFRQIFLDELVRSPLNPLLAGQKWLEFVESAGKEMVLQRQRADQVLLLLMAFLRDCLSWKLSEDAGLLHTDEVQRVQAFAGPRGAERLLELLERCMEAGKQIRRYIQLSLVLEGVVDSFCD
jgi:DNA polymerase-3 subunit delta'